MKYEPDPSTYARDKWVITIVTILDSPCMMGIDLFVDFPGCWNWDTRNPSNTSIPIWLYKLLPKEREGIAGQAGAL